MKDHQIPEAGAPAGAPRQRPTTSSQRILVVDDDSDTRLLYGFVLTRPGYLVEVAEDGAAAWEALQANRYNLLITEHEMPKLTGLELVKKLRAARMALPVVMAARRLPIEELARNPALRLAATLSKPFLERCVAGHGAKRPARDRQRPRATQAAASLAGPAVSRWFMAAMIYRGNTPRLTPPWRAPFAVLR